MVRKTDKERLEAVEKWQERMDLCLHTARILSGFLWMGITTIVGVLWYSWDHVRAFFAWLSK